MNLLFVLLLFIQGHLFIGVTDRIEGDSAVILVEDGGEEVVMEKEDWLKAEKWYLFYWKDKQPHILTPLPALESEMKGKSAEILEQLRNKTPIF